MKNNDFNQFVQQNKINNNESKLLASYILEVTDLEILIEVWKQKDLMVKLQLI